MDFTSIMEGIFSSRNRVEKVVLKGRQLDCMLLVKEGLTSKQVARKLGISHRTVDQHIAAAIENLGVANRMAAISRLFEQEQLEKPGPPEPVFMLTDTAEEAELDLIEDPSLSQATALLPPIGGVQNVASVSERHDWILRIAIACIMLTSVLILTILGLSELAGEA